MPTPLRRHLRWLASTRAALVIIGVLAGGLAYTTHYGYTVKQLPVRDVLTVLLISISVCGLASAWLHPTAAIRSYIGGALMLHSAVRGGGLIYYARDLSPLPGLVDTLQQSSGVIVHVLVFYLGFLLWHRAYESPHLKTQPTTGGAGTVDAGGNDA